MDANSIMTPATGAISSRFESQSAIDEARENRKKEWAEAYARYFDVHVNNFCLLT